MGLDPTAMLTGDAVAQLGDEAIWHADLCEYAQVHLDYDERELREHDQHGGGGAAPAFQPLVAKQILLNNFLSDVPSMAISTDRVDPDRVSDPRRWDIAQVRRYMIVFGLLSSVFDLLTFATLLLLFRAGEATFQTTWFVVSLLTELGVVLILRTQGPAWRSRPSDLLLWTTIAAALLALAVPFLGPGSRLFGFVPLSPVEMGTVVAIVTTYLVATEATKQWFFRHHREAAPA